MRLKVVRESIREMREEHGLRIMMALLNNWDLSRVNNSIDEIGGTASVISDVCATHGNAENSFSPSKGMGRQLSRGRIYRA
jgi:hypothetical protein